MIFVFCEVIIKVSLYHYYNILGCQGVKLSVSLTKDSITWRGNQPFRRQKTSKKKKLLSLWLLMITLWACNYLTRFPMNLSEKLFAKLGDSGVKTSKYGKFQSKLIHPSELSYLLLHLMPELKIYLVSSMLLWNPSLKNCILKISIEPYSMIHLIVISKFKTTLYSKNFMIFKRLLFG